MVENFGLAYLLSYLILLYLSRYLLFFLYVFSGGASGTTTARNNATAEVIEFNGAIAGSSWRRIHDMNFSGRM